MSDPQLIKEIQNSVTIPVMAKVRIGHFVEAQVIFFFFLKVQKKEIIILNINFQKKLDFGSIRN